MLLYTFLHMNYYMETNSAIKLAKYLTNNFIKNNCFTSIQVLCELLTDLNEDVFYLKKNALIKIFESEIFINWEPSHKIEHESFGFFSAKYNINKDLILFFYRIIKNSVCLLDFQNAILNYANEYKMLVDYDKAFETYIKKEMVATKNGFRNEYSYQQGVNECDNIIAALKSGAEGYWLVRNSMLRVKAEQFYSSELNINNGRSIDEILDSYNDYIDIFVVILGLYSLTKVSRNDEPSRNDLNDIYHLVYVNNGTIISDDKIYNKYMIDLFPENIISTLEFMKLVPDSDYKLNYDL